MSGSIFGFIGSIQQIMQDVFHRPRLLTLVFACVASMLAVGSFLNSRLVMQLGTRRISHSALIAVILIAATHLLVIWLGLETLPVFILLQGLMMMGFSLSTSNFSAMAMENMGEIAGTASSVQGFVSMLTGALIGALIGQSFNGTTVPLYTGFLLMAVLSLAVVAITERGRLFRPAE
jgi:DHA1 family bicyclomycin/chloramphenicol resistance-like MFS transporter